MASRQQLRKLLVKLAGQADAQACQAVSNSRPGLPFRSLSLGSRLLSSNAAQASVSHGVSAAASTEAGSSLRKLIHDYKQLSKFKLSSLVVLTASAGFAAASGDAIDYEKLAWTCLGTMGAAACANTLNQIYEVANDRMMSRTRNRPLPAGRMGRLHAAVFAAVCGAAGLWVLHEKVRPAGWWQRGLPLAMSPPVPATHPGNTAWMQGRVDNRNPPTPTSLRVPRPVFVPCLARAPRLPR